MSDMVVHFPWLHPKLGHGPLPEGVVFFDPGVDLKHGNALLSDLLSRIGQASAALSEQIGVQFFSYTANGRQRNRTS